jgi:hypothetical protein
MHIGLDLGTGLTKFAGYPSDDDGPDDGFHAGTGTEPTAVQYGGLGCEIPLITTAFAPATGTVRCDGFPLMLDLAPTTGVGPWGGRTAIEVTQSYLRCLLAGDDPQAGELVLALPPPITGRPRADMTGAGVFAGITPIAVSAGQRAPVRDILEALGRPPSRIVPTPVAAIAYLRHTRAELADVSRFIVCDIGAGSVSLSLCAVGPRATQVIAAVRLTGAAAWSEDAVDLADVDGRHSTLIEHLVTSLARRHATPATGWTVARWRALEAFLERAGDWPASIRASTRAGLPGPADREQLTFADLKVTTAELADACEPLATRAAAELAKLIKRHGGPGWPAADGGTGARIVLLGGLAALGPVRAALLAAAGADPLRPGAAVVEVNPATRLGAVAQGAALIASGQVRPTQPYPHALWLPVHRMVGERIESAELELAAAGTIDYGEPERMVVTASGELLKIQVQPGPAPLPVQIVPDGTRHPVPASFRPTLAPSPGEYWIAVGGGADGVTVTLHPITDSQTIRFVLHEPAVLPGPASEAGGRERGLPMTGPGSVPRHLAMISVFAAALLGSALSASAAVTPAPASAVAADLGAGKIPAALVILVDTSASMAPPNGLYPQVYDQLPKFLAALAKQDPQDQVEVVQFSSKAATHVIYPMGPPTSSIPLLQNPTFTVGTDIGYAFEIALDDLPRDRNAQVGGVILMSDGGMWEPTDTVYDGGRGYQAPGWAKLRARALGLGVPVTGYGLPMTSNQTDITDLGAALTAAFGSQQVMLAPDFGNLSSQLDATQQKILDSRVAVAAAPDSGHGVRVSWGSAGGSGTVHLNPAAGHAELPITLTATTSHVPLTVSGISTQVVNFPSQISGEMVPATTEVRPGHPVTGQLKLTWKPMNDAPPWSGRIVLSGSVQSPDTNAIRNYYQDKSFTVGGLTDSAVGYQAAIPPASRQLLFALMAVLLLLLLASGTAIGGALLHGSLSMGVVSGAMPPVHLPRQPRYKFPVSDARGTTDWITIWRTPFSQVMRIRHSRFPKNTFTLERGGRVMLAGIEVEHHTGNPVDPKISA